MKPFAPRVKLSGDESYLPSRNPRERMNESSPPIHRWDHKQVNFSGRNGRMNLSPANAGLIVFCESRSWGGALRAYPRLFYFTPSA
jgi:hypothetical protein